MSAFYVILGIITGFFVIGVFPWMLLRNLDKEDKGPGEDLGP